MIVQRLFILILGVMIIPFMHPSLVEFLPLVTITNIALAFIIAVWGGKK